MIEIPAPLQGAITFSHSSGGSLTRFAGSVTPGYDPPARAAGRFCTRKRLFTQSLTTSAMECFKWMI
jgi:hypothetical protein